MLSVGATPAIPTHYPIPKPLTTSGRSARNSQHKHRTRVGPPGSAAARCSKDRRPSREYCHPRIFAAGPWMKLFPLCKHRFERSDNRQHRMDGFW